MKRAPDHVMATFDKKRATDLRSGLLKTHHIPSKIIMCESCDGYHLRADVARLKLSKRRVAIIRYIALGHTQSEIAGMMGLHLHTIEWYIKSLKYQFSALSLAHLTATLIALGIINPHEFIPPIKERCS